MPIGKLLIEKGILKPEPAVAVIEEETKETSSIPLEKEEEKKSTPASESKIEEKSAQAAET